jgi:PAS domain S-box-containing protein
VIEQVSSGLCKQLGWEKEELVGQELNEIIPDGYKEVHNVRLSYLLDFR